jgi:hypothetical protein
MRSGIGDRCAIYQRSVVLIRGSVTLFAQRCRGGSLTLNKVRRALIKMVLMVCDTDVHRLYLFAEIKLFMALQALLFLLPRSILAPVCQPGRDEKSLSTLVG